MNWKNITIEDGFVKQETILSGHKATNYIPLNQIDSFGVASSENKWWLYGAIFFTLVTLVGIFGNNSSSSQAQGIFILGFISAALYFIYFYTKQTWFNITSSQTKFAVRVRTTDEELLSVNAFISQLKESVSENGHRLVKKVA